MSEYKWIVHPHSFAKKGSREISVINEIFFHGLKSYGWFGDRKILLAKDSMYGNVHDEVFEAAISIAKNMAERLNKESPIAQSEIDEAVGLRDERKAISEALLKPILDDIKKIIDRKSTLNLEDKKNGQR